LDVHDRDVFRADIEYSDVEVRRGPKRRDDVREPPAGLVVVEVHTVDVPSVVRAPTDTDDVQAAEAIREPRDVLPD
jgi:hypothetical protein